MIHSLQKEIDEWLGNDTSLPIPSKPYKLLTKPSNPIKDLTFFSVVDNMIAFNKQRRLDMVSHLAHSMSPVQYAMDFCTVKVDAGRRSGKTSYVKQRADEWSLVIVHNEHLTKGYPDHIIVVSITEIARWHDMFRGAKKPRTVYIEEPNMVFRTIPQPDLYYKLVDEIYDQTFILLGA